MRSLLVFGLACFSVASGQTFQRVAWPIPRTVYPVAGDFNGDGALDLLELGGALLPGRGDGSFGAPLALTWPLGLVPQPFPTGLAVADFDGNGFDDVVFALNSALTAFAFGPLGLTPIPIGILLNLGFGVGDALYRPVAADLDGDGRPDFVLTALASTLASPFSGFSVPTAPRILRNLGGWTFAPMPTTNVTTAATHTFVADADGDGRLDLVCLQNSTGFAVNPAASVVVIRQNPIGVFSTILPSFINLASGWDDASLGDVTGDGRPDLYVARAGTAGQLLVNQGNGTFAVQPGLPNTAPFVECRLLDWDGDSDTELILVEDATRVYVHDWLQGTWSPPLQAIGPPPAPALLSSFPIPARPLVVDLDGDGRSDLVGPGNRVLLNIGTGVLLELTNSLPPGLDSGTHRRGDFNSDGFADIVSVSSRYDQILFGFNDAAARWLMVPGTTPPLTPIVSLGGSFAEPADLDGDGDLDLFFANRSVNSPSLAGPSRVLLNGGNLVFTNVYELGPRGDVSEVVPFDAENDGDQDLLLVRSSTSNPPLEILVNLGGMSFAPMSIHTGQSIRDAHLVDFDGDGDSDVLVAKGVGNMLPNLTFSALLVNDGAGNFAPHPFFPLFNASTCGAADLDGDADPDFIFDGMIVGNLGSQGFTLFQANFTTAQTLSYAADFDRDSDIDLVYTGGSTIRRFANDGLGTFTLIETIPQPTPGFPRPERATDIDRDGDLDLEYDFLDVSHQLLRAQFTRVGRSDRKLLYAAPGSAYDLFLALGRTELPLPPFGTVFLNLSTLVPVAGGIIPANGVASVTTLVPPLPSLVGIDIYWQAVFYALPLLSGLERSTILP